MRCAGVLVLIGVFGCVEEDSDSNPFTPPESELVTTAGGLFLFAAGVELDVPPGALEQAVVIEVQETGLGPALPTTPVGSVLSFTPDDLSFSIPATVAFLKDRETGAARVYWASEDGTQYEPLESVRVRGRLFAEVEYLSLGFAGADINTMDAGVIEPDGGQGSDGSQDAGDFDAQSQTDAD